MSVFTPAEITYPQSQRLGRLATVGPNGQPHVVPVAFRYHSGRDAIEIGGHGGFERAVQAFRRLVACFPSGCASRGEAPAVDAGRDARGFARARE